MLERETVVKLTIDGKLAAWQQGAQSFEGAMREMSNGLVVAAEGIAEWAALSEDFEDVLELGRQWHRDLAQLPVQARRLTLTRMVCAGIKEPSQYTIEQV